MPSLILTILLVLVALGIVLFAEGGYKIIAAVPFILAVVIFFLASTYQVNAKEIGVVTRFGKPISEQGSGFHWKSMWDKVTNVDAAIFTDTYDGGKGNDAPIPVRLGDGNAASINATIRWHIDPNAAKYVYQSYRSDNPAESLRDAVVDTQFTADVNQVLSGYNPTADTSNLNFSPNYPDLATKVTDLLKTQVKDADGTPMVVIDKITVSHINYSTSTEDRINSIISQAAKTQQAQQSIDTAIKQSVANERLAASLKDPNVLVSKCMDALANGDFIPPAGFSCWPNSGSAVVVPSSGAAK